MTQRWNLWALTRAFAAASLALAGLATAADMPFTRTGTVADPGLGELSGLAASRRVAGRWWGLNDSGNPAELYALGASGRALGRVRVPVPAFDWEDIASWRQGGQAWLAIADTGDNFSIRSHVSIYVLPEPDALDPAVPLAVAAPREIRFTYPDGPRDCEALAADPARGRFLLIDKGRQPAGLYELPLQPPPGPVVARRIADLPFLWRGPVPTVSPIGAQRYRAAITAMDLSSDGLRLLVLTYRHLVMFERRPDEDWPAAIARNPPRFLDLPRQTILEAAGFEEGGEGALIGGEGVGSVLRRWDGGWGRGRGQ